MTDRITRWEGDMSRRVALLATLALVIAGCAGTPGGSAATTAARSAARTPVDDPTKPSFTLTLGGTVELPRYTPDDAASLHSCAKGASGGWSFLYAGGDPFVSLDLNLYPGVIDGGSSSDFDLDIGAPTGQVRLVPSGRREGAKGTGTAKLEEVAGAVRITIDGSAKTMIDGTDTGDTTVDLVIDCPA